MKLTKAIETLTDFNNDPNAFFTKDLPRAIKLGIEAMKHLEVHRRAHPSLRNSLLPGETSQIDTNRSLHHIRQSLESPGGE